MVSTIIEGVPVKTLILLILSALLPIPAVATKPKVHSAKPRIPVFTEMESGLRFADMRLGKGDQPQVGQTCAMLYRGWLYENNTRGVLFDQCQNRKKPFEFPLGLGKVIKGWDEGVAGMKAGGKRVLIVPSELAYGDKGAGSVIPPGATLLFEVELLAIKGEPAAKADVK